MNLTDSLEIAIEAFPILYLAKTGKGKAILAKGPRYHGNKDRKIVQLYSYPDVPDYCNTFSALAKKHGRFEENILGGVDISVLVDKKAELSVHFSLEGGSSAYGGIPEALVPRLRCAFEKYLKCFDFDKELWKWDCAKVEEYNRRSFEEFMARAVPAQRKIEALMGNTEYVLEADNARVPVETIVLKHNPDLKVREPAYFPEPRTSDKREVVSEFRGYRFSVGEFRLNLVSEKDMQRWEGWL